MLKRSLTRNTRLEKGRGKGGEKTRLGRKAYENEMRK